MARLTSKRVGAATATAEPTVKGKAWEKWTVADIMKKVTNIPEDTDTEALKAYVEESIVVLKEMAPKVIGVAPADYIIQSIENYVNDGGLEASEDDDVMLGGEEDDQPIIEVSQNEVKKALKALLTISNLKIAMYYEKFDEYNKEFFDGKLSTPILTIEKLNNRTLGNYTEGKDRMALEHHIRFNQNFIALNEDERVLETLRHEMIHQWQDEVLYIRTGTDKALPMKLPSVDQNGLVIMVDSTQKKRPKQWHNADFKAMAAWVNIPATGPKCHGNPAKMPEPKSYNRKFQCACVASNGYPVTIYSTRAISATCNECAEEYIEVPKSMFKGKVIEVAVSHVEKPGQDAVMDAMKQEHTHFTRFVSKGEKDDFLERLKAGEVEEQAVTDMKEGVYQKNHNAYGLGYRYWVAHSTEVSEDRLSPDELQKAVDNVTKPPKGKKKEAEPTKTPAPPTVVDGVQIKGTGKSLKGKILKFPKADDEVSATVEAERVYSPENPQDILDLYVQLGSTRKVADKLGMAQSTLSGRANKMGIDWNAGTFTK